MSFAKMIKQAGIRKSRISMGHGETAEVYTCCEDQLRVLVELAIDKVSTMIKEEEGSRTMAETILAKCPRVTL